MRDVLLCAGCGCVLSVDFWRQQSLCFSSQQTWRWRRQPTTSHQRWDEPPCWIQDKERGLNMFESSHAGASNMGKTWDNSIYLDAFYFERDLQSSQWHLAVFLFIPSSHIWVFVCRLHSLMLWNFSIYSFPQKNDTSISQILIKNSNHHRANTDDHSNFLFHAFNWSFTETLSKYFCSVMKSFPKQRDFALFVSLKWPQTEGCRRSEPCLQTVRFVFEDTCDAL